MNAGLAAQGRPWLSSLLLHAVLVTLIVMGGSLLPTRGADPGCSGGEP
jgi:hypothetical protein